VPPAETFGAAAPLPARAHGSLRRLLEHVRTPLHRDGYALVLNSAFTAATGLVYWIVAANRYSAHALGVNAALISSMMFLAGFASLNLPNFLVRFLPHAGRRAAPMVAKSYAATALVAAVAAIVFLAGIEAWAPRLQFLHQAPGMQAWFVLATVGWCVFTIQDGALTALGRAVWVPVENAVFSIAKLVLVAALAASLPLYGVFVSWTAAMLAVVVIVNAVLFGRLTRGERGAPIAPPAEIQSGFKSYFLADYAGGLAWLASINLLPVVVTAVAGATSNAYFALAWAVAFPLYAVAANIGTSLTLHGSTDRDALPMLVRKAVRQGLWLLVPGVVILLAVAPYALSLFGADYSRHGTTLLRLLALGALPNVVLAFAVAVARVNRRLRGAVLALVAQAAISLGTVAPLIHALGVTGAGVAWLGSQVVVAAALLTVARARRLAARADGDGWAPRAPRAIAARATAADALTGAWVRRARAGQLARRIAAEVQPSPSAPRAVRTDSDVAVFLRQATPPLAVKIACSDAGAAALTAQREALLELRAAPGLNGFGALVPDVLDHGTLDGRRYLVERGLTGVDGRELVRRGRGAAALAATAAGMAPLYAATAVGAAIDAERFAELVDDHVQRIRLAHSRDVGEALAAVRAALASSLLGQRAVLARVHGDLWLGNVLLDPHGPRLTGVVDWEASRGRDLPAADVAHLIISTRSAVEGREIADVVGRLLDGRDALGPSELALLRPWVHGSLDPRDLVLLAWLQHVSQRVAQSTVHRSGRWMRRNVDPILARFSS
jgi:O-antigen/teichoic acid export membrane protein